MVISGDDVTRLRRVVFKLARELNSSATDEGLTPTQASVLSLVAARGPIGLSALIDLERINPTMLSRVIGKLVDNGLVHRYPDPDDQRAVTVDATTRGHAVHERVKARRTATVTALVSQLPASQGRDISAALPALEALAQQLEKNPR